MQCSNLTLKDVNRINRDHYERRRFDFAERMANSVVYEVACAAYRDKQSRAVPPAFQTPFETELKLADMTLRLMVRAQALKGGRARKADSLQILIEKLVTRRPHLSEKELLEQLKLHQAVRDVVTSIEGGTIFFENGPRKGKNSLKKEKEAEISGLKDRLSRAKKTVQSR